MCEEDETWPWSRVVGLGAGAEGRQLRAAEGEGAVGRALPWAQSLCAWLGPGEQRLCDSSGSAVTHWPLHAWLGPGKQRLCDQTSALPLLAGLLVSSAGFLMVFVFFCYMGMIPRTGMRSHELCKILLRK